jgi:uncharacterized protein
MLDCGRYRCPVGMTGASSTVVTAAELFNERRIVSIAKAAYPVSRFQSQEPLTTVGGRSRAWGFWASLGWFGVAVVTAMVAVFVCGFWYGFWWAIVHHVPAPPATPTLKYFWATVFITTVVLMLAVAGRRAGWKARDYFALVLPKPHHVLSGCGLLVAFWALVTSLEYVFPSLDQSEVMTREYAAAMGSVTGLLLYWLTMVVTAPVAEEIIFRGFLFRGWSESRIGSVGALILTSLIFASIHTQYNLPGGVEMFGFGLLLGLARWRSGSTVLVILMHAAWNVAVIAIVALSV